MSRVRPSRKQEYPLTVQRTEQGFSLLEADALISRLAEEQVPSKVRVIEAAPSEGVSQLPQARPSRAKWFDPQTVHPIEERAFPELFSPAGQNSRAEEYLSARSFMLEAGRRSILRVRECRKALPLDGVLVLKLHAFLEHWGLINWGSPQSKVVFDFHSQPDEPEDAEPALQVALRVTASLRPYCSSCGCKVGLAWYEHSSELEGWEQELAKGPCNLLQEGRLQISLCTGCLTEGLFPVMMRGEDFKRTDLLRLQQSSKRSLEMADTDRLLTLLEEHGDDWATVCREMGPRFGAGDLLLAFLRLPTKRVARMRLPGQPQ